MVEKLLYPISFAFLTLLVFISLFIPLYQAKQKTPEGMRFDYAFYGSRFDYYNYVFMIRQGQKGNLLLHSPYPGFPPVLMHTGFLLVGLATAPLQISPIAAFLIFRFVSLGLFLTSIYFLIDKIFPNAFLKTFAFITVIFSTSFWSGGVSGIIEPIMYSDAFSITKKFILPPHHFLAIVCMISIFILQQQSSQKRTLISAGLLFMLNVLNPYMFFIVVLMILIEFIFRIIERNVNKKQFVFQVSTYLFTFFICVVLNILNLWILKSINVISNTTQVSAPNIREVIPYFLSLGPTGILGVLTLLYFPLYKRPLVRFVAIWACVPFLLWFASMANVPVNYIRLFQTYQYVPFAILAVYGFYALSQHFPKVLQIVCTLALSFGIIAYSYTPLVQSIPSWSTWASITYRNIYISNTLLGVFEYLDKYTVPGSTVLADEIISNMIPAYTSNEVIIGANDTINNYSERLDEISRVTHSPTPVGNLAEFLSKYTVSYIIVGGEFSVTAFVDQSTTTIVKIVYENEEYTVLKVLK